MQFCFCFCFRQVFFPLCNLCSDTGFTGIHFFVGIDLVSKRLFKIF